MAHSSECLWMAYCAGATAVRMMLITERHHDTSLVRKKERRQASSSAHLVAALCGRHEYGCIGGGPNAHDVE